MSHIRPESRCFACVNRSGSTCTADPRPAQACQLGVGQVVSVCSSFRGQWGAIVATERAEPARERGAHGG